VGGRPYAARVTTDRDLARWRLHTQLLAAPRGDAEHVVRSLLAVQAENPSQSAWAVATRTESARSGDLAEALASGRVLRTHVLRSTWHYVPAEDVRWLQELTSPRVLPTYEHQLRRLGDRVTALAAAVEAALAEASPLTRAEIATSLAERGEPLTGEPLTGQPLGLLMAWLEVHNRVTSGAPRDGEHTYVLFDERVPAPRRLDRDEGLAELALRYFTSHGPATERDLMYWATLLVTDVRRGIAAAGDRLESFEHDGRTFWRAAGETPDSEERSAAAPSAHLLQVLDEMYRGYQDSRWVLDAAGLVPRGREATIGMALVDGQLLAGMRRAVTPTAVVFTLHPHRALRARERAAIQDAAARYAAYLGLEPKVEVAAGRPLASG
jgi:hypothetical protein